jgi:hypothetical protein
METSHSVSDLHPIHAHIITLVDLSFSPVRGVCPSLTLKVAAVHACDNQDGALSNVSDAVMLLALLMERQP